MSTTERREYPRLPTGLIARLRKGMKDQLKITSISTRGVYVETRIPFSVGDVVEFDITVAKRTEWVSVVGVVRWCYKELPHGIGVQFLKVTAHNRERLNELIRHASHERSVSENEQSTT